MSSHLVHFPSKVQAFPANENEISLGAMSLGDGEKNPKVLLWQHWCLNILIELG